MLSGCSGDAPEPGPLRSSSASPSSSSPTSPSPRSPSASVSEAAPTLPPEAKGTDEASAEAFVRHWVAVLDYSGPAGDSRALRQLSTPGCVDCDAIADFIDDVAVHNGRIQGKGMAVARRTTHSGRKGKQVVTASR